MPANDQLTALDATFLELEQADDSALMHIGAALVFDPLPGNLDVLSDGIVTSLLELEALAHAPVPAA